MHTAMSLTVRDTQQKAATLPIVLEQKKTLFQRMSIITQISAACKVTKLIYWLDLDNQRYRIHVLLIMYAFMFQNLQLLSNISIFNIVVLFFKSCKQITFITCNCVFFSFHMYIMSLDRHTCTLHSHWWKHEAILATEPVQTTFFSKCFHNNPNFCNMYHSLFCLLCVDSSLDL